MSFLYCRPDESFLYGSVTGTVEATYDQDWLVDGRPGYPVRGTTGLALTATAPAARMVGLIAVVNHNLTGTVAITGGLTATVPAATIGGDGIPLNPFVLTTPTSATSLVMTVTQTPSIVGLLYAGQKRTLERQLQTQPVFDPGEPFAWEGEYGGIGPYDAGVAARRLTGETIVSDTGLAEIKAWYLSTRQGTRPSLIVPIDTVNDAWLVTFRYTWIPKLIHQADGRRSIHVVQFEFVEIPRLRWV
jgi:hypothetical protein